MRRLFASLCTLLACLAVLLTTPRVGNSMPICPRGQTFKNCVNGCPSDIEAACESSIGFSNYAACPLDMSQSYCEYDYICGTTTVR